MLYDQGPKINLSDDQLCVIYMGINKTANLNKMEADCFLGIVTRC